MGCEEGAILLAFCKNTACCARQAFGIAILRMGLLGLRKVK